MRGGETWVSGKQQSDQAMHDCLLLTAYGLLLIRESSSHFGDLILSPFAEKQSPNRDR